MPLLRWTLALTALLVATSPALGDIITTPLNARDAAGEPVNAHATFSFAPDHLTVVIANDQLNPRSVGQAIRSLSFTLASDPTTATLLDSFGLERSIAKDGSYTDLPLADTDWSLTTSCGGLLTLLFDAPEHTILGDPGGPTYTAANASLAGNGPHNPFLASGATFELRIPGLTPDSHIQNATFGFGTGTDTLQAIIATPVPEPAALLLLSLGTLPLLTRRPRRA